jgi:hypothetical protein
MVLKTDRRMIKNAIELSVRPHSTLTTTPHALPARKGSEDGQTNVIEKSWLEMAGRIIIFVEPVTQVTVTSD